MDSSKKMIPHPSWDVSSHDDEEIRMDSSDKVISDLLHTEKEILREKVRLQERRYDRAKQQWEQMYAQQAQEILHLKQRETELTARINDLDKLLDQERHGHIEHVQESIRQQESQRSNEQDKWKRIADELAAYRNQSTQTQEKYLHQQERIALLARQFENERRELTEKLRASEDEVITLKEKTATREEAHIRDKGASELRIEEMKKEFEVTQAGALEEKKQHAVELQKITAALERSEQERTSLVERIDTLQHQHDILSRDHAELIQAHETISEKYKTVAQNANEEKAHYEGIISDFSNKYNDFQKENDEHIRSLTSTIEQLTARSAHAESINKRSEEDLRQKEHELAIIIDKNNDISRYYSELLEKERSFTEQHFAKLIGESDKINKAKDEEIGKLHRVVSGLNAALSEENRIFNMQKEEKQHTGLRLQQLEKDNQKIREILAEKEKQVQELIETERSFAQHQQDEAKTTYEAQIRSREEEIQKLNEDRNILSGRFNELRQLFLTERNENESRLQRIQELESRKKKNTE